MTDSTLSSYHSKSGSMCLTVSSQRSRPSSTSEAMTVAVKALVIEPMWKRVESVMAVHSPSWPGFFPFSLTPKPPENTVVSPCMTASESPGIFHCFST